MKPIVEKEESGFYKFNVNVRLFTKRGFETIKIAGAFGLVAAWILAGLKAFIVWADFGNSEAGWIVLWCIVSATTFGLFYGLDETKGDK